MTEEWLTYREAAERLGSTAEAVRYRALRGKWARRRGNDGLARIQIPENAHHVRTPSTHPVRSPVARHVPAALMHALESHIKSLQGENEVLKQQLDAAEARYEKQSADLAAERQRADKAIAAFASLAERLDALAVERARPWWRRLRITG